MAISKAAEKEILEAFKKVDVKKMEIEHNDSRLVKWFRFGSFNGMMVASEIVKALAEKPKVTKIKVS